MKETKYLVVAPCGNNSTLYKTHWLKNAPQRNFDLCLLYYHQAVDNTEARDLADYFFHLKDYKYKMLHALFTSVKPELLERYDYFFFVDDDIKISTLEINQVFAVADCFNLSICQPSLTHNSYCSWPILKHRPGSFLRYMGEVEVMAPLFSRDALKICLPSFVENSSSWGMDTLWTYLLGFPKDKIAVVDEVKMEHTNPVGAGELYVKLNNTHMAEWKAILTKYNLKRHYFREYGRLSWSNEGTQPVVHFWNKLNEKLLFLRQRIRDYGFVPRIKSKLRKISGSS